MKGSKVNSPIDTPISTGQHSRSHAERNQLHNTTWTGRKESIYEQYGKYLIETKNPVLKEYLEKEIVKKESIAVNLKLSIKEMESEELSGKERGNIAKRQRRYQEIQKEIRDMRKAIG